MYLIIALVIIDSNRGQALPQIDAESYDADVTRAIEPIAAQSVGDDPRSHLDEGRRWWTHVDESLDGGRGVAVMVAALVACESNATNPEGQAAGGSTPADVQVGEGKFRRTAPATALAGRHKAGPPRP